MVALPEPPVRGYSFTDHQVNNPNEIPGGDKLDAEYDRSNNATTDLIEVVAVSINSDGTLKPAAVELAMQAISGGGSPIVNVNDVPSAQSALLSQAWAEHLPDTLPADTLAGSAITGDHWSARWWANSAIQAITDFNEAAQARIALLGVVAFNPASTYPAGALVAYNGLIYQAKALVNPGPFNATQWNVLTTTPIPFNAPGALTNDASGVLSWVPSLPLAGGTLTGPMVLAGPPTVPLAPSTKKYADDLAAALSTGKADQAALDALAATVATQGTNATAAAAVSNQNTGRNRIQNARMVVQQRGTTFTVPSSVCVDRWLWGSDGAGSTCGVQNGTLYGGGPFYLAVNGALAVNQRHQFYQRIEGGDVQDLAGKACVFSFWAAAATSAGAFDAFLEMSIPSVTDNWASSIATALTLPIAGINGGAQRFSIPFTMPATAGRGIQLAVSVRQLTAPGTLTLNFSGVQLEVGSTPSPLEVRSQADEYNIARRYYQGGGTVALLAIGTGAYGGTPPVHVGLQGMRVTPTILGLTAGWAASAINPRLIQIWNSTAIASTLGANGTATWTGLSAEL